MKLARVVGMIVVAALVVTIGTAWYLGLYEYATREAIEDLVTRLGPWGPLAFIGLFVLGELLQIPSVLFVFAAGLLWPFPLAWITAYAGANAASTTLFLFARHTIGESARPFIPGGLRHYDEELATRGLRTVIVIRLLTFLSPVMHWVLGLSRVSFRDLALGTAIGLLPTVTAIVALGDVIVAHWDTVQRWGLVAIVASAVAFEVVRRRSRQSRIGTSASRGPS